MGPGVHEIKAKDKCEGLGKEWRDIYETRMHPRRREEKSLFLSQEGRLPPKEQATGLFIGFR